MDLIDLKQQIYDEALSASDREHAFYNYWIHRATSSDELSNGELSEMLSFSQWINPIGEIISYLCEGNKLNKDNISFVKNRLLLDSFAFKQLTALEYLHSSLDWKSKYAHAKELKANWAISKILRSVPAEELEDARLFIAAQDLGKNTKRWQLEILSQTQQKDNASKNSS